jgi:drug/metabolite transporter (DMT)-like permease
LKNNKNIGRASLLLATLIWGISFVLMDFALGSISTMYILAIRFCGAAVIMLVLGARELKKINRSYLAGGSLMGVFLLAAYAFQTYGLMYTTPGKNAFLTAIYCVIVPFLYWILKKKPDRYNISAGVICILGVGLISLDGNLRLGLGDALTIVCGLFYAIHMVVTSKAVENRSPMLLTMLQFAVAGIIALAGALIFEPFPASIPMTTVWNLAFLTVMSTALCLFLQVFGQKRTPPTQASIIMAMEAVFGAAASIIFTGETLTLKLLSGFLLTFVAVIVSETKLAFLRRKKNGHAQTTKL